MDCDVCKCSVKGQNLGACVYCLDEFNRLSLQDQAMQGHRAFDKPGKISCAEYEQLAQDVWAKRMRQIEEIALVVDAFGSRDSAPHIDDVVLRIREKLAELQEKARKWDESMPMRISPDTVKLTFRHGVETYESLRVHFIRLEMKFGTTDVKRMQGPKWPRGMTFASSDPVPTGDQIMEDPYRPPSYTQEKATALVHEMNGIIYGEGVIAKHLRTGESGPGLSARYPDATKPDKPTPEMQISVDDDRWDE